MIKKGDIVPLSVQLFDANKKAKVTVQVFSPANDVIFEGPLQHIKDGFYDTKQFVMPAMDYVVACYNSDDYARSSETFYLDKIEDITRVLLDEFVPKSHNDYEGTIVQESSSNEVEGFLNGTIET